MGTDARRDRDLLLGLLDALPDAILVVDHHGVVRFANEAAAALFGGDKQDLVGRAPRFTTQGSGPIRVDIVVAGRTREGEMRLSSVAWGDQDAIVASIRDVTEERAAEERRQRADELEAVGRLAGGIAHDFNNLLTGVITFTNLVHDTLKEDDERRADLRQVLISANRAAELTRSLLAFSRREPSAPKPHDLNELLERLSELFERLLGDSVELRTNLDPLAWPTLIDPRHFEQIMTNLIVNARDAMPSGGVVTIETSNDTDSALGDCVRCRVSDTGYGMTSDVKKNLFHPFFTTKPPGKGTGLGLATVYGLLLQAKATVQVDSVLGLGTTFELRFPRVRGDRPSLGPRSLTPQPPSATKGVRETILLAEDEPIVRRSVGRMLQRGGYDFLEARTGREALDVFREHRDRVRLALLDVVMPELSGPETALRLRAEAPTLKIVFMSGYPRDLFDANEEARHLGPLILKPMSETTLLSTVRHVLQYGHESAEI